jgi:hypothetical protein
MMNAFVHRERAAEREQDERDDERPKIKLARSTKWVTRVCGARREMNAEKKERLVSGIRERVDRFGERCGGPTDECRREFARGDCNVSGKRSDDDFSAAFGARWRRTST